MQPGEARATLSRQRAASRENVAGAHTPGFYGPAATRPRGDSTASNGSGQRDAQQRDSQRESAQQRPRTAARASADGPDAYDEPAGRAAAPSSKRKRPPVPAAHAPLPPASELTLEAREARLEAVFTSERTARATRQLELQQKREAVSEIRQSNAVAAAAATAAAAHAASMQLRWSEAEAELSALEERDRALQQAQQNAIDRTHDAYTAPANAFAPAHAARAALPAARAAQRADSDSDDDDDSGPRAQRPAQGRAQTAQGRAPAAAVTQGRPPAPQGRAQPAAVARAPRAQPSQGRSETPQRFAAAPGGSPASAAQERSQSARPAATQGRAARGAAATTAAKAAKPAKAAKAAKAKAPQARVYPPRSLEDDSTTEFEAEPPTLVHAEQTVEFKRHGRARKIRDVAVVGKTLIVSTLEGDVARLKLIDDDGTDDDDDADGMKTWWNRGSSKTPLGAVEWLKNGDASLQDGGRKVSSMAVSEAAGHSTSSATARFVALGIHPKELSKEVSNLSKEVSNRAASRVVVELVEIDNARGNNNVEDDCAPVRRDRSATADQSARGVSALRWVGSTLVTGGLAHEVLAWPFAASSSPAPPTILRHGAQHTSEVTSVCGVAAHKNLVLTGGLDGRIIRWDLNAPDRGGTELQQSQRKYVAFEPSPFHCDVVAMASAKEGAAKIEIVDTRLSASNNSLSCGVTISHANPFSRYCTPRWVDANVLSCGTRNHSVRIWDVRRADTPLREVRIEGATQAVDNASYLPLSPKHLFAATCASKLFVVHVPLNIPP